MTADFRGQVHQVNRTAVRENDGLLDHVLEFTHVARVVVGLERRSGLVGDLRLAVAGEVRQEVTHQQRHVLAARAQRRNRQFEDVEAVEQVVAEAALLDERLQVAVRRRHDPHADVDAAVAAERFEDAFLEDAQQLHLRGQWHLRHLVEEEGAAVRRLEAAFAPVDGSGERTALVSEQFGLEQRLWKCGAADGDEWTGGARALVVEGPGDQFLAGAALAGDEDRRLVRCEPFDPLEEEPDGAGVPYETIGSGFAGWGHTHLSKSVPIIRQPGREGTPRFLVHSRIATARTGDPSAFS